MKKRAGEAIELSYQGDSEEDSWIVRGHGQGEAAIGWAVERYHELGLILPDRGFIVRDQWARWSWESTWDGPGRCLRTYWESGPGRFPVTVAYDADDWAIEEDRKAHQARKGEEVTEQVLAKYPDATDIRVNRYGSGDEYWGACFKLPCCVYPVTWIPGDTHVMISGIDVPAFLKYHGKES